MARLTCIAFALLGVSRWASAGEVQGHDNDDVEFLFERTCIYCHGANLEGAMTGVPDLVEDHRLSKPDSELVDHVMNGFRSEGSPYSFSMPPKGGNPKLTEADVRQLIPYLRFLAAERKTHAQSP